MAQVQPHHNLSGDRSITIAYELPTNKPKPNISDWVKEALNRKYNYDM